MSLRAQPGGGAAARALLSGLVDYAGLFPPAGLGMADAVARYANHRQGPRAWMLGRFVVPVARLTEFAAIADPWLPRGPQAGPWHLSAISGGSPDADAPAVAAFNAAHGAGDGGAVVDIVETRVAGAGDVARLVSAWAGVPVDLACEVPLDGDLAGLASAAAAAGAVLKARLGGITPEAVPPPAQVAAWLAVGAGAGARVKATAGLHHAVRGLYNLTGDANGPRAVMHGFLNVFVAAALAWRVRAVTLTEIESRCLPVIEETDAEAFRSGEHGLAWRDVIVTGTELQQARVEFASAFGSCSFDDPVADLVSLGMLPEAGPGHETAAGHA